MKQTDGITAVELLYMPKSLLNAICKEIMLKQMFSIYVHLHNYEEVVNCQHGQHIAVCKQLSIDFISLLLHVLHALRF